MAVQTQAKIVIVIIFKIV